MADKLLPLFAKQPTSHAGPVIFLDRDGTIIVDKHYLHSPDQVELETNAAKGLSLMAQMDAELVVISNQSGVGRGYFDSDSVKAANDRLAELLEIHEIRIDSWFFCPHIAADGCNCRKPRTGMVEEWRKQSSRVESAMFVVGDKISDVEVAFAIGGTGILIDKQSLQPCHVGGTNHWVVRDLVEAADLIKSLVAR